MNTYLEGLARRNDEEHGADLLGLVLTGSAGRGIPTERSDLDVYVVLTDAGIRNRETTRSVAVDEIPISISELGRVAAFGTPGWWSRWSFAWAFFSTVPRDCCRPRFVVRRRSRPRRLNQSSSSTTDSTVGSTLRIAP